MYQQLKIISNSRVTKTMLLCILIAFICQLTLLSLSLSKKYLLDSKYDDKVMRKTTYSLFRLLGNEKNNLEIKKELKYLSSFKTSIGKHNVEFSIDSKPLYSEYTPKFKSVDDIKKYFEKISADDLCISYKVGNKWLNYCATTKDNLYTKIYLLSIVNVCIIILILAHIQAMVKLILPLKHFQQQSLQAGQSLQYNPIHSNSINIIKQTASTLNYMQQRMIKALHDKTKILGFISHDLRTPLTRIKMRLQLLKFENSKVYKDINEMQKMIDSIMNYSRDDICNLEHPKKINLISLINSIINDYYDMNKSINFNTNIQHIILSIQELNFKRAIVNIVDNAFKYSDKVDINLVKTTEFIIISIIDNGPGVPNDLLDKLSQPFFQKDKNMPGMGLGLTITKEIIQMLNGYLFFTNIPEGGLCVEIKIPYKY